MEISPLAIAPARPIDVKQNAASVAESALAAVELQRQLYQAQIAVPPSAADFTVTGRGGNIDIVAFSGERSW